MSKLEPVTMFLSYAHKDESLCDQLKAHLSLLQHQGLVSTWHDRRILPGADWAQEIDTYLETAPIVLLLVSASFFASNYCIGVEMKRALSRHEAGQARVIPILVRPCDWKSAPFVHLQILPKNAKAITDWNNRDKAWADVIAGIRRVIEELPSLSVSTSPAALPPIWNVPYPHNPLFTGREELLTQLVTTLHAGQPTALSQPQAISGLGGIGKTQLALEYAYRYRADYQAILWAQAETHENLTSSYLAIATLLNLPEKSEQENARVITAVKVWLQRNTKWLLILDNADDLRLARDFLPPSVGGHVLLTTRAQATGRFAHRLEVDILSTELGALFLLRRAGLLLAEATFEQAETAEQARAKEICEKLGGLPLALDQAGAYIEETGCSLSEYQRLFQHHRANLLAEHHGLVEDHPKSVATTWSLSFAQVEQNNLAAADLLRLCAFLAPDAIPEEIITKGAKHLGPNLAPVGADAYLLNQAVEALRAYSLLSRDPHTHMLSVHRLVQAVMRDSLSNGTDQQWKQQVVCAVSTARPNVVDVEQWNACERWLPHALICTDWIKQEHMMGLEAADLLDAAGYYLDERGRYVEAELLLTQAHSIYEQRLGAEHPDTDRSLNNLALLYYHQGMYEQVELLLAQSLSIREWQSGVQHPHTAHIFCNLTVTYENQGKYEQTELLLVQALSIHEQRSEHQHSFMANSLNNRAAIYYHQGKYIEAEPLYQRALSICEQQLGAEHLDTASSLNNLADLYRHQGKYSLAEPLYQRALSIREERLGATHPHTALSLNNLANLYQSQGKYSLAEPLYQQALSIQKERLGATHPPTKCATRN